MEMRNEGPEAREHACPPSSSVPGLLPSPDPLYAADRAELFQPGLNPPLSEVPN